MSMRSQRIRLLTPPPEDWDADAEDIGELSGFPGKKVVENAGQAFHDYVQRKLGLVEEEDEEDAEEVDDGVKAQYESKRKQRHLGEEEDLYAVLGLGEERYLATAKQIKNAYRKLVLVHHPDKQKGSQKSADDTTFKLIQKAHDILSNPESRRAYDSTDAFDDSIPSSSDVTDDASFYAVFGPVFRRNSKWSTVEQVPQLGDESTPYAVVMEFYRFWRQFRTWRDFSSVDEYDLKDAESRDEKRWMQRQNQKLRKKEERKERIRLNKLIETAFQCDPRIKEYESAQRAKKMEKAERKRKKKEEKMRREAEERAAERKKEEEAAQAIVDEKERLTKNVRKLKTKVRQRCEELRGKGCKFMTEPRVEKLATGDNVLKPAVLEERLSGFLAAVEGEVTVEQAAEAFRAENEREKLEKKTQSMMAEKKKKDIRVRAVVREVWAHRTAAPTVAGEWSADELSMLAKGLRKFNPHQHPAGTRNRWELVQQLVPERSVEEIIAKTAEVKSATPTELKAAGTDSGAAFQRWKAKTKVDEANPDVISTRHNTLDRSEPWTGEEQVLLEKALLEFYPDDPDRWEKIAEAVGSRNRNDCIRRFRYLYTVFRKSGAATSGGGEGNE